MGAMDTFLLRNFKNRKTSLRPAPGLPKAQPTSKSLSDLKNPEKVNPGLLWSGRRWAPASLHTGHAQGVDRLAGLRSRDESGSACARPSEN